MSRGTPDTYHVNMVKLKLDIVWTGGLPNLSGLPHPPGALHLHVNRPQIIIIIIRSFSSRSLYKKKESERAFFKMLSLQIFTLLREQLEFFDQILINETSDIF